MFDFLGWAGYLVILYILTFFDLVKHVLDDSGIPDESVTRTYWLALLAACLGAWVVVGVKVVQERRSGRRAGHWIHLLLSPLIVVFYLVAPLITNGSGEWLEPLPHVLASVA